MFSALEETVTPMPSWKWTSDRANVQKFNELKIISHMLRIMARVMIGTEKRRTKENMNKEDNECA